MTQAKEMEASGVGSEHFDWAFQSLMILLNGLDAAVWATDREDGRLLFADERARKMLGEEENAFLERAGRLQSKPLSAAEDVRRAACGAVTLAVQEFDVYWSNGAKARLTVARDITEISRMEEAFRACDARFRATFDNAAHAIGLTDDAGRFTQVNAAWEKMFGYTAEEAVRLTHLDVTHPDFWDISREKLSAVARGELDLYRIEKQYLRKDGSVFWADLCVTPVHLVDRSVGAALGVIADINDRKAMEEALRENEARLRATVDNLAQVVTLTDRVGRFTHVNAAFEQMFGYTPEEAINLTNLDITHPDDIDISREKLQALINGELKFYRMEKRYIRKDGSVLWCDLTVTPILGKDKSVAASVAVIVDISRQKWAQEELQKAHDELELRVAERTSELAAANKELLGQIAERARVQEALKLSEERFRAIFETATDCIFIKDRELRYTLVNPAMERLLQLPASSILQLRDEDLFGRENADYFRHLERRVLGGEIIEAEHTRSVNGAPLTFLDIRAPMRIEQGEIVGICGISRNITERAKGASKEAAMSHANSPIMHATLAEARMAAETDIIILLTGESGAGKDHMASFIHDHSRRSGGPFYSINCAAIPPELAESELFGHEQGAFTGASRRKRGLLELAEGGTLLLNEIAELPLHLQSKLLTFLDSRSFTRVGGEKPVKVNARLIAATNRDLEEEVSKNRFRLDLFYRLNVLSIRVPALRERIEDLPALAKSIIAKLEQELQLNKKAYICEEDMAKLSRYDWPGNIRELRNVLERALIVSPGPKLQFDFLQTGVAAPAARSWTFHFPPVSSYLDEVAQFKRNLLLEALSRAGGNKQEACRLLGITRHVLRRQLERVGLSAPK